MYSFMGGGLFCAIVANILLVVSTATDYWMQYRLSGSFAHQGLWRYCLSGKCYMQTDSIGECETDTHDNDTKKQNVKLLFYKTKSETRTTRLILVKHNIQLSSICYLYLYIYACIYFNII